MSYLDKFFRDISINEHGKIVIPKEIQRLNTRESTSTRCSSSSDTDEFNELNVEFADILATKIRVNEGDQSGRNELYNQLLNLSPLSNDIYLNLKITSEDKEYIEKCLSNIKESPGKMNMNFDNIKDIDYNILKVIREHKEWSIDESIETQEKNFLLTGIEEKENYDIM